MGVYDDVCTFDFSPTSTVSTSSSSSSSSSSELASPVYENVEELTGLCSRSWKMMGKRSSKPSMSDFLAQLPPPPPSFDEKSERYGAGFGKRVVESSTSTASSSASSRRPIISSNNPPSSSPVPLHVSSSTIPPPPLPPLPTTLHSNSQISRCFDMRPLSLPHKEMQRIEREQSHRVLIITLLIITIFIVMIALGIYTFYDVIVEHINNISGTF
ncbi:Wsv299 [Caenorhabditis elegans]|uniref:Wsv299 n=1 Tax=Caenorhabditis elegans TaxID=6239 RepID=O44958_CAEEL|nr:Wsv299 [Caenorhabditis elegans]CCD62127.1 Wsv299 [Caenorhabditis elegans]|eukprot:NP_492803.1 Uncharacterized protein CELE_C34B2.9 [Caenorhabditis elegans]